MAIKVTTEFEGQTVTGKLEEKGVQLKQFLGKVQSIYIPLNILEVLIDELRSVAVKIKQSKIQNTEVKINLNDYKWYDAKTIADGVKEVLDKEWEAAKVSLGDGTAISGGTIKVPSKVGGKLVSVHNGETVLTSDDVGNIHVKGNVDFSDAKIKQPEEVKSHDTDKDDNINVNYVLDEISKIFNSTFTIKNESDIGMVAKELAKKMKDTRGKF